MENKIGAINLGFKELIYVILFLIVFATMIYYIGGYQDGASNYEEIYAKNIVNLINLAEPGTEICLDVSDISGIASNNGKNLRNMIGVDNVNNEISVSLRGGKGSVYKYFNDVDIVDYGIDLISGSSETNRFCFKVNENLRQGDLEDEN